MKVAVIGYGVYGSALGAVLERGGHQVLPYDKSHTEHDFREIIESSEVVVVALPSGAVDDFAVKLRDLLGNRPVILASKGLSASGQLLSQPFAPELESARLMVLSGPGFASEIAAAQPTVLTGSDPLVQQLFANSHLKVELSDDINGILACGAYKNIFALGAGLLNGLGAGQNAQAMLIIQAYHELKTMVQLVGGRPATVELACGLGDLILTCSSQHSRNFHLGQLLAKGEPLEQAITQLGTVEGVETLRKLPSGDTPLVSSIRQIVLDSAPSDMIVKTVLSLP
jgi:glycerol-3-phosphate dehydrogenase (NAD(P)+)